MESSPSDGREGGNRLMWYQMGFRYIAECTYSWICWRAIPPVTTRREVLVSLVNGWAHFYNSVVLAKEDSIDVIARQVRRSSFSMHSFLCFLSLLSFPL